MSAAAVVAFAAILRSSWGVIQASPILTTVLLAVLLGVYAVLRVRQARQRS
jgi:type III secretory pathway component EscV